MSCCKFMKHDRWSNVLFLHWSIPNHLVPILKTQFFGGDNNNNNKNDDSCLFELDQTSDGNYWIGLILLTEQNVGPIVGRRHHLCEKLLVTHHGVNVRTYIKGVVSKNKRENSLKDNDRGIAFASLECDDFITSYGANYFGMPYHIASIERTFGFINDYSSFVVNSGDDYINEKKQQKSQLIQKNVLSSNEVDDLMCNDEKALSRLVTNYHLKSIRSKKVGSHPSLLQQFFSSRSRRSSSSDGATKAAHHLTKIKLNNRNTDFTVACDTNNNKNNSSDDDGFTVECSWTRTDDDATTVLTKKETELANFFVERYHVYTRKYGLRWQGTVEHEPWPIEKVTSNNVDLKISNVDQYEPKDMIPIIQYMADTKPESALFSTGVGPIEFQMLRPV